MAILNDVGLFGDLSPEEEPTNASPSRRARTWLHRNRLRVALEEGGSNKGTTTAMANLAEAIQGLVTHMRTEQQMIREWADGQGEQNREIKRLLERLARQKEKS